MNKQIEEMAKDMCEYYYEGTCYQDKKPCDCKCEIFTDAQYLYSKGYRKSTDVARKIFAEIDKEVLIAIPIEAYVDAPRTTQNKIWITITELKKKYTEEGKCQEF